jgi:hypothetical protein
VLVYWEIEEARLLEHHNLHQEFAANGQKYYVVFVVVEWRSEYYIEESFLDLAVNWDGPFPSGRELWPEALRDLVRLAYDVHRDIGTDMFCTYVLP